MGTHTEPSAPPPSPDLVSLSEIHKAAEILDGVIRRTPLIECGPLSTKIGGPAYLKCENLQSASSFKVRGAFVRMSNLTDEERERGVVAASAGNHAQGVAVAASLVGTHATVFMPRTAPLPKIAATRAYGAQVKLVGEKVDDAYRAAQEYAESGGQVFVPPFDHRDIVAGQGTVALEILEELPEVRSIVTSVGGGGLLAGIGAAVNAIKPDVDVVGVQARGAAAFAESFAAKTSVQWSQLNTIADGIAVGFPGEVTLAHAQAHTSRMVTVTDEEISRALLFCLERAKMVVEPAGSAGVAALLGDPRSFEPPVVAVLSGGNIDPLLLQRVIEHGLASAGRYLSLSVKLPDRPGSLTELLGHIASEGVNVADVDHVRHSPKLHLGEAEITISVETRGNEHSEQLMAALRRHEYYVERE